MADTPTPAKAASADSSTKPTFLPWTDWTWAAILLRVCAGLLLLLAGTDKFKSATNPATYTMENYYGSEAELANPEWNPKFIKIVQVVYANSGLDNSDRVGKPFATAVAWSFYAYGYILPWLMLASGLLILLGLFSRLGYFIGGFVWISLIVGQLLLPDAQTVNYLLMNLLMTAAALALQGHNRFRITKC